MPYLGTEYNGLKMFSSCGDEAVGGSGPGGSVPETPAPRPRGQEAKQCVCRVAGVLYGVSGSAETRLPVDGVNNRKWRTAFTLPIEMMLAV